MQSNMLRGILNASSLEIAVAILAALILNSIISYLIQPKNAPPFYYEWPYIPWLGSLVQFATNPRRFLERAAAVKGDCFTIQLFGRKMTFLFGSEGLAHFFKQREQVYDIREAYAMTVTTFGPGVVYDCSQSKMAEQLAVFKNGLSDANFHKYMELVQEEVAGYFEKQWGDEGEADLLESLSNAFTLTSSRCLLGDEVRQRWEKSGMAKHYLALDESFVPILFFFPWVPNPHRSSCIAARKLFEKIFLEVLEERKVKRETDPNYEVPHDFLQVLQEAKYKNGDKFTLHEITGLMIAALLGGQHTSNVTGTWLMAHLLKSPEWFQKIMEEQEAIFKKKKQKMTYPSILTYDELQEMTVFEQVLSETLRLHPPFFQVSRTVKVNNQYKDYVIPKGHYINISPLAAMRTPELWGDTANDFDPSRFANKEDMKPYSWIPFGGGLHQCSGRKFAWNSLKASLTWLMRNYELEFVGKGANELPNEDYTTMVVAPTKQHVRVKYRRRKN